MHESKRQPAQDDVPTARRAFRIDVPQRKQQDGEYHPAPEHFLDYWHNDDFSQKPLVAAVGPAATREPQVGHDRAAIDQQQDG